MKALIILIIVSLWATAHQASAQTGIVIGVKQGIYAGADGNYKITYSDQTTGIVYADFEFSKVDGVMLGYSLDPNWTIELESMYFQSKLSYYDTEKKDRINYQTDMSGLGLSFAYRSVGKEYFLVRAGAIRGKAKAASANQMYYGIGGGVRVNERVAIEGEYLLFGLGEAIFGLAARYTF